MRAHLFNDTDADDFSKQLLNIGNGTISLDENNKITLTNEICTLVQNKEELIDRVFPDILDNYLDVEWICERAILPPTNDDTININVSILARLPGDSIMYESKVLLRMTILYSIR